MMKKIGQFKLDNSQTQNKRDHFHLETLVIGCFLRFFPISLLYFIKKLLHIAWNNIMG